MPDLLTAKLINTLPPKASRYLVSDLKMPGLGVMVYPSGTKSFVYRYRLPKTRTTNTIPVGQTTKITVKDARSAAKSIAGEVSKGIDPLQVRRELAAREKKSKTKLDLRLFNYIDKYYQPYAMEHSKSVVEILRILRKEFEFLKGKPIDKINSFDIEKWRKEKAKKGLTFERIRRIYSYLKACINTAVKHYKLIRYYELQHYSLKRKPSEKVNPPKIRYLTKDEECKLLAVLENRDQALRERRSRYVSWQSTRNVKKKIQSVFESTDYPDHITPIIVLAYQTGLDLGDIFDLDWQQHIDFDNNQIRKVRNKTKHKQNNPQPVVIPMTKKVRTTLKQWGNQHGTVGRIFISPVTGERFDNITKAWHEVREDAELGNFRFKDFRHTFGSWLAINGVDLLDIRDLMGHKDVKTTQVYAHLCPKRKTEAMIATFS